MSDDSKSDWYERAHGKSEGPRQELVREFARRSQGGYHQMTLARFALLAKQVLGADVAKASVEEIEAVGGASIREMALVEQWLRLSGSSVVADAIAAEARLPRSELADVIADRGRLAASPWMDAIASEARFSGSALADWIAGRPRFAASPWMDAIASEARFAGSARLADAIAAEATSPWRARLADAIAAEERSPWSARLADAIAAEAKSGASDRLAHAVAAEARLGAGAVSEAIATQARRTAPGRIFGDADHSAAPTDNGAAEADVSAARDPGAGDDDSDARGAATR